MNEHSSEAGERFRKRLIVTAKGRHGAKDMNRQEAKEALDFLFSAEAHPAQVGGFLTAMRFKGTTVEEMMGFLDAMEGSATLISPNCCSTATALTTGAKRHSISVWQRRLSRRQRVFRWYCTPTRDCPQKMA